MDKHGLLGDRLFTYSLLGFFALDLVMQLSPVLYKRPLMVAAVSCAIVAFGRMMHLYRIDRSDRRPNHPA